MIHFSDPRIGVAGDQSYAPFRPRVAFSYSSDMHTLADENSVATPRLVAEPNANSQSSLPTELQSPEAILRLEPAYIVPLSEYQWSGPGRDEPLKRAFDIAVSMVLLIALAPLMLVVSLAIRLNDRSPVLVRQLRIGRFGRVIGLMKFRTRPDGAVKASGFGRFLLKAGIDKLPQLLNVLRGDLSLVGPKAITEVELPRYGLDVIYYLGSRPGITGSWRTGSLARPNIAARIGMDREYARTRTFLSDLKLMFATVRQSIMGRRAP